MYTWPSKFDYFEAIQCTDHPLWMYYKYFPRLVELECSTIETIDKTLIETPINSHSENISTHKLLGIVKSHITSYPTPMNLTYFWSFGFLTGCYLAAQIVTGLCLALHYTPTLNGAFDSIIHILENVEYGWFLKYAHANGASFFLGCMYVHICKNLYFRTYMRKGLWFSGLALLLLSMGTAFLGYTLPWGQMSYWGATVITNFVSAMPLIGDDVTHWIWGGFSINENSLHRFFIAHFILPFILLALTLLHLYILHTQGSSNPLGMESGSYLPFFPYFWIKDIFAFLVSLVCFSYFIFFNPDALGHPENWEPANPLVTPRHITPEWYFLPFYAILRAIPSKGWGIIAMFASIAIFAVLPFADTSIRNGFITYAKQSWIYRLFFWQFIATVVLLGYMGASKPVSPFNELSQFLTLVYFSFFYLVVWTPQYEYALPKGFAFFEGLEEYPVVENAINYTHNPNENA